MILCRLQKADLFDKALPQRMEEFEEAVKLMESYQKATEKLIEAALAFWPILKEFTTASCHRL
jgi:hypothetical protein